MYTDEQKYDGISNSFDFKLTIFLNICKRLGLLLKGYIRAFLTMLKGLALNHYYNSDLSTRAFTDAYKHVRQFFEGPEYHRKNLNEWNGLSLRMVLNKNLGKPIY